MTKRKQRILVVDDQRDFLHCTQKALSRMGYEVILAGDGNEAIASIDAFQPDLIVLDIMMPGRSGFLVLEYLRLEVNEPIPVIIVTASQGARQREYAKVLDVADYLVKPFSIAELTDRVEQILAGCHET